MKCMFCNNEANNQGMSMDQNRKMALIYTCNKSDCLEAMRKPFRNIPKTKPKIEKMFP